jgi:predicted ester cyclase
VIELNEDRRVANKELVRRLIDEVVNGGDVDLVDELFAPDLAPTARQWFGSFRTSFPDLHMEIVDLISEPNKVAGRFRCSATQLGEWRGKAASGRRFEDVDEVYIFEVADGRFVGAWGLEDNLSRMKQLGISVEEP